MKPNSIIVIQTSSIGKTSTRRLFDRQKIKEGENYLFFRSFNDDVLNNIDPGIPQLIFTSHVISIIDANEVAQQIKMKNPQSIVFALTTNLVGSHGLNGIEGRIDKFLKNVDCIVKVICNDFISGSNRESLIKTLEGLTSK